jgi:uncharacterized protein YndB with AHSA1/START domain
MANPGNLTVEAKGEREVLITRAFNAPRVLVFNAHSKPELVRQWLLGPSGWTMPVCEIDFRVGGRYRYVWRHDDGREMSLSGVHREILKPERIVATELFDEDWTGGEAITTTTFGEKSGKTLLTVMVLYSSREARDGALRSGMTDGMEFGYQRLDRLLTGLVEQRATAAPS